MTHDSNQVSFEAIDKSKHIINLIDMSRMHALFAALVMALDHHFCEEPGSIFQRASYPLSFLIPVTI